MLQVKIGLIVGLAAPLFLLTGCFDSDNKTVPLAENDNNRIRLAMLLPPRSGLTPLSDDAFKLSRWSTTETLVILKIGRAHV